MSGRRTIGEHAAALMRERGKAATWWGDVPFMEEVAAAAGVDRGHPIDTIRSVVAGLSRSALFEADYMVGADRRLRNRVCLRFTLRDAKG